MATKNIGGFPYWDKGEHSECNHNVNDGCKWCCPKCNMDTHICPGCSEPTIHSIPICIWCQENGAIDGVAVLADETPLGTVHNFEAHKATGAKTEEAE